MSLVEELGFESTARVTVVHVDDVGMCEAANAGALLALDDAATCGSIMVPCPGFEAVAEACRARPELDLGVHLTLNAEWEGLRWGPVADDVPGLVSPDGGMWRTSADVVQHASPDEVARELRAQVRRALDAGVDVTHLDAHMGTAFDPKFVDVYLELGREFRLPLFIPRLSREILAARGLAPNLERLVGLIESAEQEGFPVFDSFDADSLSFEPGSGAEHNESRVEGLAPGLSYLITHCARGGPDLERIAPDWRQRDEEHRIYSDGTMSRVLTGAGVRTIGMRPLRERLRARL